MERIITRPAGLDLDSPAFGSSVTIADILLDNLDIGIHNAAAPTTLSRLFMHDVTTPGSDSLDTRFAGEVAAATTVADPLLAKATDPCTGGLYPSFGSPLVDAGDPTGFDRDGTRADIGATGGEYGLDIVPDVDEDGYSASRDCDDANPNANPGIFDDAVGDEIDEDCDGADGIDLDRDGASSVLSGGDDCNDVNPAINPSATDTVGNGVDDDCDGHDGVDADDDGASSLASGGTDCDDADATRRPGLDDSVGNTLDEDCDGADGVDGDGDTHASVPSGGDDCDDAEAAIYPGANERAGDGIDSNCDGADGTDSDGDGTVNAEDCALDDPAIHPGAADTAGDSVDQDCDGTDGVDGDSDGFASTGSSGDDCDDANPDVNPNAEEDKGGLDLDCDGEVDPPGVCGCSTSTSSSGVGALMLLGGLVLRRRRAR